MKKWHIVAVCLLGLLLLAWSEAAVAGPKVAIVQGDEKILKGSVIAPERWLGYLPKHPEGGRQDLGWTLEYTPESIQEVERMVRKAVDLAGGWPVKQGDTVFIKFNGNNDQWYLLSTGHGKAEDFAATNTDGRIARAVALLCKESGASRIIIGEAAGLANSIGAMRVWGAEMAVKDAGAELVDLDNVPYRWVPAPHALAAKEYAIPEVVLDADVVISVANLKTHGFAGTTGVMKNIGIGVPPNKVYGAPKTGLRHDVLHKTIADVCDIVKPKYQILGAIYGGEGAGPTMCHGIYQGIILAGEDPVAMDYVGTACMGELPERFGYLRVAQQIGVGTYKDIQVVGKQISEVMKQYAPLPGHGPGSFGEVWGWQ
ncbi:MAG: DUF362 domain-containing protein [Thermodesulfobacteriota bacterium]|jgi:uncharacterized protein (DUF362 family)